jgi:predicted nuclease of predicted toxin-antitoxin system
MKFLVDTQLPLTLAKFLSSKGFDANHTSRYPDGYFLDDEAIRRIAKSEDRIIVTKDSDFLDRFLVKGAPPCVLLLRMGNLSNSELLAQFEKHLTQVQELFEDGAGLVEFYEESLVRF